MSLSSALDMPKERKILARWVGATDHRKVEISIKWSQGDSGGPLMYQGEDGRWLLMGTVPAIHIYSIICDCLFYAHPKVFSSFFSSSHKSWSRWAMGSSVPTPTCLESTWGWPSTSLGLKESPGRTFPDFHSLLPFCPTNSRWRHYFVIYKWPALDF